MGVRVAMRVLSRVAIRSVVVTVTRGRYETTLPVGAMPTPVAAYLRATAWTLVRAVLFLRVTSALTSVL